MTPPLQRRLPSDPRIQYIDVESGDAYAILAYFELVGAPISLPFVIVNDTIQEAPNIRILGEMIVGELKNGQGDLV